MLNLNTGENCVDIGETELEAICGCLELRIWLRTDRQNDRPTEYYNPLRQKDGKAFTKAFTKRMGRLLPRGWEGFYNKFYESVCVHVCVCVCVGGGGGGGGGGVHGKANLNL